MSCVTVAIPDRYLRCAGALKTGACADLWLKPYRDVMKAEYQVEWSYIMFCSDWTLLLYGVSALPAIWDFSTYTLTCGQAAISSKTVKG
ncbi:hypothetical protein DV515_00003240 [Chloebia gouldiae]|uniref:Uncharacterized protein n=1 Tax=Chloebia gouldiae TaxID=44316 RepID=A0A3L8STK3_CHLGU|nr:hypothetical protein DV515_00003240 [Chloebia gouldiae]